MSSFAALVGLVLASAPGSTLEWVAPPQCPDERWAQRRLDEVLADAPADLRVRVDIAESGAELSATIGVHTEQSFAPRTIVGRDCEALASAAILVVAVAVDPVAVSESAVVIPPPPADGDHARPIADTRRVPPQRRGVPASDRTAAQPRRPPLQHTLRFVGGVGSQIVPAPTGAIRIGYAAGRPGWRLEAHADWIAPSLRRYGDGAGARVQAVTFGIRGCPAPRLGRVTLAACLGVVAGPVLGRGVGVPRRTRATSGWVAGELGIAAIVAVHPRLAVVVEGNAFASAVRPAFHLGDRDDVFDTPRVGGRALVGLEVRLR